MSDYFHTSYLSPLVSKLCFLSLELNNNNNNKTTGEGSSNDHLAEKLQLNQFSRMVLSPRIHSFHDHTTFALVARLGKRALCMKLSVDILLHKTDLCWPMGNLSAWKECMRDGHTLSMISFFNFSLL